MTKMATADCVEAGVIHAFCATFHDILTFAVDMDTLEKELESDEEDTPLLEQLARRLMKLAGRRLTAQDRWEKALQQTIEHFERKHMLVRLQTNPFQRYTSFALMPAQEKLRILCDLVDWAVVQDSSCSGKLTTMISSSRKHDITLRALPIGSDSEKREYWYFGDGQPRLYRSFKLDGSDETPLVWETLSRSIEDVEAWCDSMQGTSHRQEKSLLKIIKQDVLSEMHDVHKKQEQEERQRKRLEREETSASYWEVKGPRQRKQVKYSEFYGADDLNAEDSDEYHNDSDADSDDVRHQKRTRSAPSRRSRRLLGGAVSDSAESYEEEDPNEQTAFLGEESDHDAVDDGVQCDGIDEEVSVVQPLVQIPLYAQTTPVTKPLDVSELSSSEQSDGEREQNDCFVVDSCRETENEYVTDSTEQSSVE